MADLDNLLLEAIKAGFTACVDMGPPAVVESDDGTYTTTYTWEEPDYLEVLAKVKEQHAGPVGEWQPIEKAQAEAKPGAMIDVRQIGTYRWHAYSGKSQEWKRGKRGRWQRGVWHGDFLRWENAELPKGTEFKINRPVITGGGR